MAAERIVGMLLFPRMTQLDLERRAKALHAGRKLGIAGTEG